MNAIHPPAAGPAVRVQDPPNLHLAAAALAYPVSAGNLSFMEAAGSLARAAIDDGLLDRMTNDEFHALCGRLEHSLVMASIRIDAQACDRLRAVIAPAIRHRRPRDLLLLIARALNELADCENPPLPVLPYRIVEEICKQEVQKAVAQSKSVERSRGR